MANNNKLNRIHRPIDSFLKYFNEAKPYHTKLLDLLEVYKFSEGMNVSFEEQVCYHVEFGNTPLCFPTGFGLDFDDNCGYDAISCCNLFDCTGGYGLVYDNDDLLLTLSIDDVAPFYNVSTESGEVNIVSEGWVTIQGNHTADTRINILSIPDSSTVILSGDYTSTFNTHKIFLVVPIRILSIIGNDDDYIEVSGNQVSFFDINRAIYFVDTETPYNGSHRINNIEYDEDDDKTIIHLKDFSASENELVNVEFQIKYRTQNSGVYQVDSAILNTDGDTEISVINSSFPLTDDDQDFHGAVQIRTGLSYSRIVQFEPEEITEDNLSEATICGSLDCPSGTELEVGEQYQAALRSDPENVLGTVEVTSVEGSDVCYKVVSGTSEALYTPAAEIPPKLYMAGGEFVFAQEGTKVSIIHLEDLNEINKVEDETDDYPLILDKDIENSVYFTDFVNGIQKIDSFGNITTLTTDNTAGFAVDSDFNYYIRGVGNTVIKYDSSLTQVWESSAMPTSISELLSYNDGEYIYARLLGTTGSNRRIVKIRGSDGNIEWQTSDGAGTKQIRSFSLDEFGNVYVGGWISSHLRKFNANTGAVDWAISEDRCDGLIVDTLNQQVWFSLADDEIVAYDYDGNFLHAAAVETQGVTLGIDNPNPNFSTQFSFIATLTVDPEGNLYASGEYYVYEENDATEWAEAWILPLYKFDSQGNFLEFSEIDSPRDAEYRSFEGVSLTTEAEQNCLQLYVEDGVFDDFCTVCDMSGTFDEYFTYPILNSIYDPDTNTTKVYLSGHFNPEIDGGYTLNLYGYFYGAGFDGDAECKQPKHENIHTQITEALHIYHEIEILPLILGGPEFLVDICGTGGELTAEIVNEDLLDPADIASRTFLWEQLTGPTAIIDDPTALTTTYTVDQGGDVSFRLTADAGTGYESTFEVFISDTPTEFTGATTILRNRSLAESYETYLGASYRSINNNKVSALSKGEDDYYIYWSMSSNYFSRSENEGNFIQMILQVWDGSNGEWVNIFVTTDTDQTYFEVPASSIGSVYRVLTEWKDQHRDGSYLQRSENFFFSPDTKNFGVEADFIGAFINNNSEYDIETISRFLINFDLEADGDHNEQDFGGTKIESSTFNIERFKRVLISLNIEADEDHNEQDFGGTKIESFTYEVERLNGISIGG